MMSRTLPSRPNLEHLRKQAKALLRGYPVGDVAALASFGRCKPAAALEAAIRLDDAGRVRDVLARFPASGGMLDAATRTMLQRARSRRREVTRKKIPAARWCAAGIILFISSSQGA
jgi:hypothetical protein